MLVLRDFLLEERFYEEANDFDTDEEILETDQTDNAAPLVLDQEITKSETNSLMEEIPLIKASSSRSAKAEEAIFERQLSRKASKEILSSSPKLYSSKKDIFTFNMTPAKLVTKEGFDSKKKRAFEKEIELITSLIEGNSKESGKPFEERKPGYKILKNGGVECINKDELKAQEGIVLELMKTAGKTLMEGKNVVGISLPVRIFEPRSQIERICDGWDFAPIYLKRAAQAKNPIERFKEVIAFAISGLYVMCKQSKPFNPILGETYQGFYPDGTEINCEHVSHHPPITSFYVLDGAKKWKYHGYYEYKGKLNGNAVIGALHGPNIIEFDDGQVISYMLPPLKIGGLLYGSRTVEYVNDFEFEDKKNDLKCKLSFYEAGFFANQHPSDYFEGNIVKRSDPGHVISKINGRWTESLFIDGKKYWDLKIVDPIPHFHTLEPLTSDCRFREDLVYLARKDLVQAQEHKVRLEVIQRADRKLRNEYKEKNKIKGGH